ncbi:MAG: ribosome maturation factor RimM [Alphaproteobacteria bacterium]
MIVEKEKICIGAISGVHGIQGAVVVKPFTDSFDGFLKYKTFLTEDGADIFTVTSIKKRPGKDFFIAHFKEVPDRNAAEEMKGTALYVLREDLPELEEDAFYHADLIGMAAKDATDGTVVGHIKTVDNFGAGDVLEIAYQDEESGKEKSFIIPFTKDAVPEINAKDQYVKINAAAITR